MLMWACGTEVGRVAEVGGGGVGVWGVGLGLMGCVSGGCRRHWGAGSWMDGPLLAFCLVLMIDIIPSPFFFLPCSFFLPVIYLMSMIGFLSFYTTGHISFVRY